MYRQKVMSTNDVTIFSDVFSNFRDSSCLLVGDCLVKEVEGILNFCMDGVVPWRRVWIGTSYLGGSGWAAIGDALESFSMSI